MMELFPFMSTAFNFAKKQKASGKQLLTFCRTGMTRQVGGYQREQNVDQEAQETTFVLPFFAFLKDGTAVGSQEFQNSARGGLKDLISVK